MPTRKNLGPQRRLIICFLTYGAATAIVNAETLRNAYLDKNQNVHIVTSHGHHVQVTTKRNATSLEIAPNNETVAWLVINNWIAEGDIEPGSEELAIYHNKKKLQP